MSAVQHIFECRASLIVALLAALCLSVVLCSCQVQPVDSGQSANETESAPTDAVESESADGAEGATTNDSPSRTEEDRAAEIVSSMTLDQKIDQLFIITPEALTGVGQVVSAGETTKSVLHEHAVGGLVYFADNLEDPDQTKRLLANTQQYAKDANSLPIFLAVDEEGGTVARVASNSAFGVKDVGDMRDIGATGNAKRARKATATIGDYLDDLGFNLDFAPVADVAVSQNSTMYERSFGSDPQTVAKMVSAAIKGFKQTGVLCAVKHFPGIGSAEGDSHNESISTDETLEQMEGDTLVPFVQAIADEVPFVMVGHLSVLDVDSDGKPASLSHTVITGLLRNKMGYDGIIVTDSLSMGAVTQYCSASEAGAAALEAGADMLLMPEDFAKCRKGIKRAIKNGDLTEERIDESAKRIVKTKLQLED